MLRYQCCGQPVPNPFWTGAGIHTSHAGFAAASAREQGKGLLIHGGLAGPHETAGPHFEHGKRAWIRCPPCSSEMALFEDGSARCTACGCLRRETDDYWHTVECFKIDHLPKYLDKWPETWDRVKGLGSAGIYLSLIDRREILVCAVRVVIILCRTGQVLSTAAIRSDAEGECLFAVVSLYGTFREKLTKSFIMSVAAFDELPRHKDDAGAPLAHSDEWSIEG